jgi:hypothetical protein
MAPYWNYKRAADYRVATGESVFCGKYRKWLEC